MKDIEAITTEDCIRYHSTYYAPNNATVVVVGDVRATEALKQINDAYGHAFGDEVIASVARTVNGRMRANSYLGRYGGDEFMLIIDQASLDDFLARVGAIQAR